LDLTQLGFADAVLFGDETSFGLTVALNGVVQPKKHIYSSKCHRWPARPLPAWGIENARLSVRTRNDAQLAELEERILSVLQAQPNTHAVLSTEATSIQYMRKLLKWQGIGSNRFQTKAYWAPGKTRLDGFTS